MPLYKRTDRLTVCSRHYTLALYSKVTTTLQVLTLDVPLFRDPAISDLVINNERTNERGLRQFRAWTKLAVAANRLFRRSTLMNVRTLIQPNK